jgi:hypothetical protein
LAGRKLYCRPGALAIALVAALGAIGLEAAQSQDWSSGQDSPVHDSDRTTPLSGKTVVLEDGDVRVVFDAVSGALVQLVSKRSGWNIQESPELGESFRIFVPTLDRSYNPVLGARNKVSSITKSADGRSVTMVWSSLQSEYRGKLDITLTGKVSLEGPDVAFDMQVRNESSATISSVDWPVLGALQKPADSARMQRMTFIYGTGEEVTMYPVFENERGYNGTNYPMQMGEGRYNLVLAEHEGLYIGTHDTAYKEVTRYAFELKPGYSDSFDSEMPKTSTVSEHPVRIVASVEHFPFVPVGQTMDFARIVLSPFQGDWHHGADVYRRWHATWFHRPVTPAWAEGVNSWQQIQINSAEDDLRTPYRELPQRAKEAAKDGISAIQLVGWNNGGQDRGNPSHDTDPRLGTYDDLKAAIAKIHAMGVHVILFNKYTWVDTSTEAYKGELGRHVALDPNGQPYVYQGYMYQTPEQLADMNTRRLAVACTPDPFWQDLSVKEFRKSIDLGASGILYDEVQHHGGANYCFTRRNGQLIAESLWAGDSMLGQRFRDIIRSTIGEKNFLMAGEAAYDLETRYYSLTYHRISPGHIPLDRYDDPSLPMMIAITGFDDRNMINEALRYRYIMSFEPFNFKGNLQDFPITMAYGLRMDALRRKYQDYLWDAEFRDDQDATVEVNHAAYSSFSTFRRVDGKRAVVVVNKSSMPITAEVMLDHGVATNLAWVSPEDPELHPSDGTVKVAGRSAVTLMER